MFAKVVASLSLLVSCTEQPGDALPQAPTALEIDVDASQVARLHWVDNSNDETHFMIDRKDGTGPWLSIVDTDVDVTAYEDGPLPSGQTYKYRVMAMKGMLESDWTNEVIVEIP